ncbi:hypothetical protein [Paucibacter sp. KBW04]|uniref:hypothetical protein n=1 Tax=Paucibacter sp. KBW04 TaxID=2153361 RepID=UPI0012DFDD9F|nr:hypothetical protein [Paucibacter sp. KBW04]
MTLLLRRIGRGNWSPLLISYDHHRQGQLPILLAAKVGDRIEVAGVAYRVSVVIP